MEPRPLNSRSDVNNRSPRCLTAEEVIDLFQSLEDEKKEIDVDDESDQSRSRPIAILIDLSQNLILRMSGHCPKQDLSLQRDDTTYETLNGIFFYSLFTYLCFDI